MFSYLFRTKTTESCPTQIYTMPNDYVYIISVDGTPSCFIPNATYTTVLQKMQEMTDSLYTFSPDFSFRTYRKDDNTIVIEREHKFLFMSYPQIVHRITCSKVFRAATEPESNLETNNKED